MLFRSILFQENNVKSPLSDNHSNNITSHDNKEGVFPTSKPLIKLEPTTKMELAIKTEPVDVKPFKVAPPQKPLPIQLPRLKPKPPPVVIVSPQVWHFLFFNGGIDPDCFCTFTEVLIMK